mgnify:FL=1
MLNYSPARLPVYYSRSASIKSASKRIKPSFASYLHALLTRQSELFGEREVLVFWFERYTYRELRMRVEKLADALIRECNPKRGDRVAIVFKT